MTQESVLPPENQQVVGLFLQVSLVTLIFVYSRAKSYHKTALESFYKISVCLFNDQKRRQRIERFVYIILKSY